MKSKIVGSLGANLIILLIQLALLWITANYLSLGERGEVSLFVLNVAIIIQVASFVGGSSLVYLASRASKTSLIGPSYAWAIASSLVISVILYLTELVSEQDLGLLMAAGAVHALASVNMQLLLGYNNIRMHNAAQVVFHVGLFGSLVIQFFVFDEKSVSAYVLSYFLAATLCYLVSSVALKLTKQSNQVEIRRPVGKMLSYGTIIQIGTLAQQLNNRFSFYLLAISFVLGDEMVGMFSIALMGVEKAMIVSRSFSSVQYAAISNNRSEENARRITLVMLRLVTLLTLLVLSAAVLLPESIYLMILSDKYEGVKEIIYWVAPSIFLLAISNILSHYFSGLGRYKMNTIASLLGLIVTLAIGFVLIPEHGIKGAALTTMLSYSALLVYQIAMFFKDGPLSISDFVIKRGDFRELSN